MALLEAIIAAYEKRLGVSISVHDYTGVFSEVVPTDHLSHDANPFCMQVKKTMDLRCSAFDLKRLQNEIEDFPDGGFKHCHAGFIEVFMPLRRCGRVEGMLFAGVFHPRGKAIPFALSEPVRSPLKEASSLPLADARILDEHYDMLSLIKREIEIAVHDLSVTGGHSRKQQIDRFIEMRYNKDPSLDDLCSVVGLNPSRMSEILRSLYGKTFPELINEMRLHRAKLLLTATSMPVHFVAAQCGYGNAEYFFRVFRKRFGMTPNAWRKQHALEARG
ncbi:MAG: helix-turn-helix domain-containing protein [Spirochaetota bacterium]